MKTRLILVLCVLVSSVLAAPSAMAATISLTADKDLLYEGATGETNTVVVTNGVDFNHYVITDNGAASLTSETSNCTVIGLQATCNFGAVNDPLFVLGDGNDTFTAAASRYSYPYVIFGNSGADVITGGPGDDYIWGGVGADTVNGGPGNDDLIAEDVVDGSDTYNGGAGLDCVDYSLRVTAVKVSLDGRRNDGKSGEHDKVGSDIECASGGSRADVLTGNSRANWLYGDKGDDVINAGGGADTIEGGAGDDHLTGGNGKDTIKGDAGNDTLISRDRSKDTVDGGKGTDKARSDRRDVVRKVEQMMS